tara:strand:+ start:633 stop:1931 length:1299 start_codon:yes stop_codon:yes gene_type:complete
VNKDLQKKIAVVGSGISGISSAFILSSKYKVHLFEKNNYFGGHTRTINVSDDNNLAIDTGFIVYNDKNYPDLIKFFNHLDILTSNSDMSFAVSDNFAKVEYGGKNLKSLFAQRKNIVNFNFLKMTFEIFRFYKLCKKIKLDNLKNHITISDFLDENNFSFYVRNLHIYPLISSIWSTNHSDVLNFPFKLFLNFFNNHDLFNFKDRPQWKFVNGGSNTYIKKILSLNKFEHSLNSEITDIKREANQIKIISNNKELTFDFLVLATHADQALQILADPSSDEINILSKFKYTKNKTYLHSDITMMPINKKTWSSWNFIKNKNKNQNFTLTYWMNNLQKLETKKNYFVTINPIEVPNYIYNETIFTHPKFDTASHEAQKRLKNIQGTKNTFFCGAYHGYGFHEDGIQSASYIAKMLEVDIPWKRDNSFYNRLQYM